MLAVALAKMSNTHGWSDICTDLDLPARHATRITAMLRHTQRTGTWPAILTHLERLMTTLQRHPPPVDYPARRELGKNIPLLVDTIEAVPSAQPTETDTMSLVRQLWEQLTGGDIAYAPEAIRLELDSRDYAVHRSVADACDDDLLKFAYRRLQRVTTIDGPFTWCPAGGAAEP
jgi:hypothetical protein